MPASNEDLDSFIKTKRECLDLLKPPENFCPTEWDGLICWKTTAAGQNATSPCPKLINPELSTGNRMVTRYCSLGGQWEALSTSCRHVGADNSFKDSLTTALMVEQTSGNVADDGLVLESSHAYIPVATDVLLNNTHELVMSQGGYIYDYYKDIDIIRALVNCSSIILLLTAIIFWVCVWFKARYGHPYRCVAFIVILTFSLLYHSIGLTTLLVYVPNGFGCQVILTLKSYSDIGMYTFFFTYVILCIGVAMRRLESGVKFYFLVSVTIILPLVLVAATTALRIVRHPDSQCDLLDDLAHGLWYDRAPKCFLLFGTICLLSVLLYWLFCFDNSMFKMNRDFLLIRHSTVTLIILVCYCFFLELYQIIFLRHNLDGEIESWSSARSGMILNIMMCAKGSVVAVLLCFFDIEIFDLIYTFPCCPDLGNAVVDQTWEKRIRSESKVKFFDDSSSDDNHSRASGSRNPFVNFMKDDRILQKSNQSLQSYGSVSKEDLKNS